MNTFEIVWYPRSGYNAKYSHKVQYNTLDELVKELAGMSFGDKKWGDVVVNGELIGIVEHGKYIQQKVFKLN